MPHCSFSRQTSIGVWVMLYRRPPPASLTSLLAITTSASLLSLRQPSVPSVGLSSLPSPVPNLLTPPAPVYRRRRCHPLSAAPRLHATASITGSIQLLVLVDSEARRRSAYTRRRPGRRARRRPSGGSPRTRAGGHKGGAHAGGQGGIDNNTYQGCIVHTG